ncbi:MAG: alpha/beta hydrolase [Chloroflexi bacterium]|nr:alpha/beta hydrolase [Chloroflexota bacterium]
MPEDQFIIANGVRLRYLDYGGSGQPAVFYHATGFVSELWTPVIESMSPRFRCIAVDQRGHGRSDKTAAVHTWATMTDDFIAFLRAMRLEQIVGIGHSSGATAIAVTAGRYPELVDRAVMVEPTVISRSAPPRAPGEPNPLVERTLGRRARWPSRAEVFATLLARPPYASWAGAMKEMFADHAMRTHGDGALELECSPVVEASIYGSAAGFDPWSDLPKVTQPLLVIHGTGPSVMPTTRVNELAPVLRTAQFISVPEGGHLVLMEAPDKIVHAVSEFLRTAE